MELPDRVTELPPICARCAAELTPGEGNFFLVRIEAIADPTPPTFSQQELDANNRQEMEKLLAEMEHLSAQEALDQVYRRMFLHLCNRCYGEWIENPAGWELEARHRHLKSDIAAAREARRGETEPLDVEALKQELLDELHEQGNPR